MSTPSNATASDVEANVVGEKSSLLGTKRAKEVHSRGWLLALVRASASIFIAGLLVYLLSDLNQPLTPLPILPNISVAFIGNSMMVCQSVILLS